MMRPKGNKKMTIEQLAQMSQREFLKLATKEDLKNALVPYATKEDLEDFKDEVKEDFKVLKEEVKSEMRDGMGKFLIKADQISKKLDTAIEEGRAGSALYKRHDRTLENHEKRISALESVTTMK